jgi:hypothetical protein
MKTNTVEATQQALDRLQANLQVLGGYGVDLTGVLLCLGDSQIPFTERATAVRTVDTTATYLTASPNRITVEEAQHRLDGASQMCLYGIARIHRGN